MNTLHPGMRGSQVKLCQLFLRGLSESSCVVTTGVYDEITLQETKVFQENHGLTPDGIVGPKTLSEALRQGFSVVKDQMVDENSPNWPPRPTDSPLSPVQRSKIFGKFAFVPAPTTNNPEAIKIVDGWADQNITSVVVPQLIGVPGSLKTGLIQVHQKAAGQILKLFADWQSAGLSEKILGWGGSWSPRFIRGSRTSLSNHAWGTAFDINVQWNGLGVVPALRDEKGSVRDLVQIAYDNGFYWGGWFNGRPDGMHFEVCRLLP